MPADFSYTTLSQALTADAKELVVASTTNFTVGNLVVSRDEAMMIREVRSTTQLSVLRGWGGTRAKGHRSGQIVYTGTPDRFKAVKDSLTAVVGDSSHYPDFMMPGQRAKDEAGNEYILLSLAATCYSGTTVLINQTGYFTAVPLVAGRQGPVAVLREYGTSDTLVWGQIYGYAPYVQDASGTSGVTSAYVAVAASSVSSPNVGMAAYAQQDTWLYIIKGMFIIGAAVSTTTSATSSTGINVPCWLNYPYVEPFGTPSTSGGG